MGGPIYKPPIKTNCQLYKMNNILYNCKELQLNISKKRPPIWVVFFVFQRFKREYDTVERK